MPPKPSGTPTHAAHPAALLPGRSSISALLPLRVQRITCSSVIRIGPERAHHSSGLAARPGQARETFPP